MMKFAFRFLCAIVLLFSVVAPASAGLQPGDLLEHHPQAAAERLPVAQLLQNAAQVAAGGFHGCIMTAAGGVLCWGDNRYGQLGDGTTSDHFIPTEIGLTGVKAITAGYWHTCALLLTGTVQCWGYNHYGQLGDGTTTNRYAPVAVMGLGDVTAISAGRYHTCAVLSTGVAQCWGYNFSGQLGNGFNEDRFIPVTVTGLAGVAKGISAGYRHTCALVDTGAVQCWGNNLFGALGNESTTDSVTPVTVVGLAGQVKFVSAARDYTCALLTTGAVQCWGDNRYGQLGDGTLVARLKPVDLTGLTGGVQAISAGFYHTCAILDTGVVQCWGYNRYGELGDGTTIDRRAPGDVAGLAGAASMLIAGYYYTCAVLVNTGSVQCWGSNFSGQLGNGFENGYSPTPLDVPGLLASRAAGGSDHTCVIALSGVVQCWGNNSSGQLGDGTTTDSLAPVNVVGLATGGITTLSVGEDHVCALSVTGGVQCWGKNDRFQLGDGTSINRSIPVNVTGLAGGVTALSAGLGHTCALLSNGAVQCWGYNVYGQLGDATTKSRSTPVPVAGLVSGVKSIAAGYYHTCALLNSGIVQCWGYNANGQLGDGTTTHRSAPLNVTGLADGVKAISAGSDHTCALLNNNTVQCWGLNSNGQLGDGTTTNSLIPVNVTGLVVEVTAMVSGGNHTCVLLSTGFPQCWGMNSSGQLGDETITARSMPVDVKSLAGRAMSIASGWNHTCVVLITMTLQCWGDNTHGQLGQGTAGYSSLPVSVVSGPPAPPLVAIIPARGRNDLPVRVVIQGNGFQSGALARLERPQTVAAALENVTALSSTVLMASVPAGLGAGSYDIVVSNPGSDTSILAGAYTVLNAQELDDLYAFSLDLSLEPKMVRFPASAPVNLRLTLHRLRGTASLGGVRVDFYQGDPQSGGSPIGSGTVKDLGRDGIAISTAVPWTVPAPGDFHLYAVIDRYNLVPELDEENNTIHRVVTVLPELGDDTPPVVENVTINGGEAFTSSRAVRVTTTAVDSGAGISNLLFIEYTFSQAIEGALNVWEAVRVTPWLPYDSAAHDFFWVLNPSPGVHFLQVWASDRAGNISSQAFQASINYQPVEDFLSAGEVRIYRRPLEAPQNVILTLTSSGSADLYVWTQGGSSMGQSLGAPSPQTVNFTASENGIYQYEVEAKMNIAFALQEQIVASPAGFNENALHPRQSPYTNSVPLNAETGVPSASVKIYQALLPMLWRK